MIIQPVNDIARICFLKGIRNVVLSPGSRCAPLTLAFNRHEGFRLFSIPDERSAAFVGLGLAEESKTPTVLVCTSGTALLNYGPAIAEAFYRQIPLLVLTADRPPEWIDQWDGQTLRQQNLYAPHIVRSFSFPVSFDHSDAVWHAQRIINEAIDVCQGQTGGPVHVNIPLREPFYPEKDEAFRFSNDVLVTEETHVQPQLTQEELNRLMTDFGSFEKVLIVAGQHEHDPALQQSLSILSLKLNIPLVGDIISNLHGFAGTIRHADSFLMGGPATNLAPDLLITLGQSVISKNLKLHLRANPPASHWHIGGDKLTDPIPDPFQSLKRVIRVCPSDLIQKLAETAPKPEAFFNAWIAAEERISKKLPEIFDGQEFNEFEAVYRLIKGLNGEWNLHLANSMPVRYANFTALTSGQNMVKVFANRGTSGIDGSSSTSVGISLAAPSRNLLISGDMAFFYDINAFWHNHLPDNLKIFLLNNHGGGIFRLLPGASSQPELEEYFETRQNRTAKRIAEEFGFGYFHASERNQFNHLLPDFLEQPGSAIFEVETKKELNQQFYSHYKSKINA